MPASQLARLLNGPTVYIAKVLKIYNINTEVLGVMCYTVTEGRVVIPRVDREIRLGRGNLITFLINVGNDRKLPVIIQKYNNCVQDVHLPSHLHVAVVHHLHLVRL